MSGGQARGTSSLPPSAGLERTGPRSLIVIAMIGRLPAPG
jgi:hypothetical protein